MNTKICIRSTMESWILLHRITQYRVNEKGEKNQRKRELEYNLKKGQTNFKVK